MIREERTCSECGNKSDRLVKGLCPRCYSRQHYQARKTEGKAIMAQEDIAPIGISPDTMIGCEPYKGWWTARACIGFQMQVKEAAESPDPMNPLIAKRRACLDCAKGKVIAAALKDQDFSVKLPPKRTNGGRGPEILVRENGQLPKGFRMPKAAEAQNRPVEARKQNGATKYMDKAEIVQQRGDLMAKRPSEAISKTPKNEEDENDMAEVSNDPPVLMCVKCGGRPQANPVTHLCSECHSEAVRNSRDKSKETIAKRHSTIDHWFQQAMERRPDLRAVIEEQARAEMRTVEAQAIWMIMRAAEEAGKEVPHHE